MNEIFEDDYPCPFLNTPIPQRHIIAVSADTDDIEAVLAQIKAIPGVATANVVRQMS